MHITLASDNNYAQHLGVALVSILENNTSQKNIVFHILENNLSLENKEKIKSIGDKYKCQIIFYNTETSKIQNFPELGHLSKATYLRLFIPELLPPEIKKVIYLDCDLVALKDLNNLYQIDLEGKPLGAIKDVKAKEIIRIYFYPHLKSYFNDGVMLIDVESWRKTGLTKKAIEFIGKYKNELTTADQDVLNCLFNNDWKELGKIYNLDMKHQPINSLPPEDTAILHYSDKIKPWSYLYTGKNKKYYFKYLKLTPWKDFKYKDKNLKNFFKKYKLALLKSIKNILRRIIPSKLIDWHKKRFLKRLMNKNNARK